MSPSAAVRSRIVRREDSRLDILESAALAIAEHGFHGMTMRGLASATGRSLANFYNYFKSKEEVLFALQTNAFETLNTTLEGSLEDVDAPAARLYVFIFNHLRYVAEHRSVMRVLVHEASALPPSHRKKVRVLKERYFRTGRDIVKSIILEGCKKPGARGRRTPGSIEIDRSTYSIFGMLNWSYGWYDPERHGSAQDVARTIHGIALCGLVTHCPYRPVQLAMEKRMEGIVPPSLLNPAGRNGGKE